MNDFSVNIIGYLAAIAGTSLMLPQVIKSYKSKSVADISWGMLVLYFLNCLLWLVYGLAINSSHVAVTNSIALVISMIQIFVKIKYA